MRSKSGAVSASVEERVGEWTGLVGESIATVPGHGEYAGLVCEYTYSGLVGLYTGLAGGLGGSDSNSANGPLRASSNNNN